MSEMQELAKRAVACKHWRWMPGMLTDIGRLCQKRGIPLSQGSVALYLPGGGSPGRGLLPDLTDPATVGCLLALVREAWDLPSVCVVQWPEENKWIFPFKLAPGFEPIAVGESEAAALVNALRLVE